MSATLTKIIYYACPCGYKYEPAKGDPESNYAPGTEFDALPTELTCPRCQRAKIHFRQKRRSVPTEN